MQMLVLSVDSMFHKGFRFFKRGTVGLCKSKLIPVKVGDMKKNSAAQPDTHHEGWPEFE